MQVIVRPPSAAFRRALSQHPERDRIDPDRALRQHEAFVAVLESAGADVIRLPPEPAMPDAPFVSDALVALAPPGAGSPSAALVVVARPADPSRRPEVASVLAAARRCLTEPVREVAIDAPDSLEGGDVIVYGSRIAIGLSARTTEGGALRLARAAEALGYRAFLCTVSDRLHLATAVTAVARDLLVGTAAGFASLDAASPDAAPAPEIRRLLLPDGELAGANVLAIGSQCVVAAGNPTATGLLRGAGLAVAEVELDEFGRADGGPTCLVNVLP